MFEKYSHESLRAAAISSAAQITFSFCREFRRHKDNIIPELTLELEGEAGEAMEEALDQAKKLEVAATSQGKAYKVHFHRLYYQNHSDLFDTPMTRLELALILLMSHLSGMPVPEPVQQLS